MDLEIFVFKGLCWVIENFIRNRRKIIYYFDFLECEILVSWVGMFFLGLGRFFKIREWSVICILEEVLGEGV